MKNNKLLTLAPAAIAALGLTACQVDDDGNITSPETYLETTVDATSYTESTFVDLDTNTIVTADDDWDIAFKRYNISVNDTVKTAIITEQNEFYDDNGEPIDSVFVNATSANELAKLTTNNSLTDVEFKLPTKKPIIGSNGGTFYDYDMATHLLHANSDAVWVIRSNTGEAYAKLRPTRLYDDVNAAYVNATFELFIQGSGEPAFSNTAVTWTVPIPNGVGNGCFDIDTASPVSCDSTDWDINFNFAGRTIAITLNGGESGPGLAAAVSTGPYNVDDTDQLTAGIQNVAEDQFDIVSTSYAQDGQAMAFTDYPWYTYSINNDHKIWPNYRVYAVQTESGTYLIQLTNYYNAAATSGFVSYRLLKL